MYKNHTATPFKKTLPALFATLSMTIFIVCVVLAFGLNALLNQNVTPVKAAAQPASQVSADQTTVQELQATINQYQNREAQYQNQLQQAADQINQISQQNQQYQQLFQALQNAGVIRISQDGRVFISRGDGLRP